MKGSLISVLLMLSLCLSSLTAQDSVEEILKKYNPDELSETMASEILRTLMDNGYKPGPELDDMIRKEGFDPFELRTLAPPPPRPGEGSSNPPADHKEIEGNAPQESIERKIYASLEIDYGTPAFTLSSIAIKNGEILDEYKCEEKADGREKTIPLSWSNIPAKAKSLAAVMYHFPNSGDKTKVNSYLLLWGIDPDKNGIEHGATGKGEWFMGQNKDGRAVSYTSPCSPSPGAHEYMISLFALGSFPDELPKEDSVEVDFGVFMDAIENSDIIGRADLKFDAVFK